MDTNTSKCRICLIKIEPELCRNIFDQTCIGLRISQLLSNLTSIKFRKGDGLPNGICGICEAKVNILIDLRSTIVASSHELRKEFPDSLETKVILPPKLDAKNEERFHLCGLCLEKFTLESDVKEHRKRHILPDKMFKCHLCCKTFKKRISLISHGLTHNPKMSFEQYHRATNPYGCQSCPKRFCSNEALQQHVKSLQLKHRCGVNCHKKRKPFLCEICGKKCTTKMALKGHWKTHKKDKPKSEIKPGIKYFCQFCMAQFPLEKSLRDHVNVKHLKPKEEIKLEV